MFQAMYFDSREGIIKVINVASNKPIKQEDFPNTLKEVLVQVGETCPLHCRMVNGVDTLKVHVIPLHPMQLAAYRHWYSFNNAGQLCFYTADAVVLDSEFEEVKGAPLISMTDQPLIGVEEQISTQGEAEQIPQ